MPDDRPHPAIGVLTSGGDAPGMNAAIRAVVRTALHHGRRVIGVENGYDGLIDGTFRALGARDVGGILPRGGTFLRTRRSERFLEPGYRRAAVQQAAAAGMDALVVIGGEGSMRGAHALAGLGMRVMAIPASIDNDVVGTDVSIGVDTALNTIVEAVDKLRDTASSHNRCFLVETMGRGCGYLAVVAGVVCGAEIVLIPEVESSVADVLEAVRDANRRGKANAIVIVAEGASIHIGDLLKAIEVADVGFSARASRLGHIQRGGSPTAFDRMLAARLGAKAVQALIGGESGAMAGLDGRSIKTVALSCIIDQRRDLSVDDYEMVKMLAR